MEVRKKHVLWLSIFTLSVIATEPEEGDECVNKKKRWEQDQEGYAMIKVGTTTIKIRLTGT